MQVSLCIRVYCSISCTKEHCNMHSKCITSLCTCIYCIYVFVLVSMHIVCTMHSSLCMHSTVTCITCMHFQCFKEKHCTLIVFHNRIFPKNWGGGQMHYWPPPIRSWGGGMAPLAPPWRTPCSRPKLSSYYSLIVLNLTRGSFAYFTISVTVIDVCMFCYCQVEVSLLYSLNNPLGWQSRLEIANFSYLYFVNDLEYLYTTYGYELIVNENRYRLLLLVTYLLF